MREVKRRPLVSGTGRRNGKDVVRKQLLVQRFLVRGKGHGEGGE